MTQQSNQVVDEITYPSGGKLQIFKSGRTNYIPSEKYLLKRAEYLKERPNEPLEQRAIKHKHKKILFTQGRCIAGDKMFDKIFKMHEIFDFTKAKQ